MEGKGGFVFKIEIRAHFYHKIETGAHGDHPHGKEIQKSKMAVWGGLTNSCEKNTEEEMSSDGLKRQRSSSW